MKIWIAVAFLDGIKGGALIDEQIPQRIKDDFGDSIIEIINTEEFEKKSYQTPEYLFHSSESDIQRLNSTQYPVLMLIVDHPFGFRKKGELFKHHCFLEGMQWFECFDIESECPKNFLKFL